MRTLTILLAAAVALAACKKKEASPVPNQAPAAPAVPEATIDYAPNVIYVPAHAHVAHGPAGARAALAITLGVRNLAPQQPLTLHYVDYYDSPGQLVRRYLAEPRTLRPLETDEFTVRARDDAGGSGASFLIGWSGSSNMSDLMAEAVMVGHTADGYLSFTSRGVTLRGQPSAEARALPAESLTPEPEAPASAADDPSDH
jgi:hypothetical protein